LRGAGQARKASLGLGYMETLRLWRFNLMFGEGGFRGGGSNVAQVTLVKEW